MATTTNDMTGWQKRDFILRIVGTTITLAVAAFGIYQYQTSKEREFKKAYYKNEIRTVNDVFQVIHHIDIAKTNDARAAAVDGFWKIWYGDGRTYLTPAMFKYLHYTAEYINGCISKITSPARKDLCSNSIWMSVTGFAEAAREDLSSISEVTFTTIKNTQAWNATSGDR